MLWVFAVVVFGSSALIGRSLAQRAARNAKPALPPATQDRTLLTLQVGDVVEHLDRDYLVEGALLLSESPRAARLCRVIDGAIEKFVYASTEGEDAWLLEPAEAPEARPTELDRPMPMRLEKRWRASTLSVGRLGARTFDGELTVYEYAGGDRLLIVLDGPTRLDAPGRVVALLGSRLLPHAVDILPGRGG